LGIVNQDIRTAVKAAIKTKGMTQEDVAGELGVNRVYINRMLSGDTSQMPGRWSQLLDLLGLELTVKPKNGK